MARIRCRYLDCAFLDEGYCSAALIELDSNKGCLTYTPNAETPIEDDWTDTDELEDWEDLIEEDDEDDKDDDLWMDEEEDEKY